VTAFVTFVSVDDDRKPAPVPPLLLESDEDRVFAEAAVKRREHRLAKRKQAR